MRREPTTKTEEVIDWADLTNEFAFAIKGTVNFTFANPVEGKRIIVLIEVSDSVQGNIKVNFPEETWTERGPNFNISAGYIGIYEFICLSPTRIVCLNGKTVS